MASLVKNIIPRRETELAIGPYPKSVYYTFDINILRMHFRASSPFSASKRENLVQRPHKNTLRIYIVKISEQKEIGYAHPYIRTEDKFVTLIFYVYHSKNLPTSKSESIAQVLEKIKIKYMSITVLSK